MCRLDVEKHFRERGHQALGMIREYENKKGMKVEELTLDCMKTDKDWEELKTML